MARKNFHKQYTEPTLTDSLPEGPLPEYVGPYKIEALLNKGGMSWLYMGVDPKTKKPIAIKVLPSVHLKNEQAVELFLKESRMIALTNHPNIVKLYEEGPWEGGLYIAMEWIHGISLRQFLVQQSFSLKRSLDIILQVGYALKHLHSHGIIHRDLKPENILISEDGIIKVIDFGIAQIVKDSPPQNKAQIVGTPNYMSPEQKESPNNTTYASDIYSLGVLAYELILGKLSYGIIDTSRLPKRLRTIISKALAVSIEERYQDIDALLYDLSEYLKSGKIEKEKPEQDQTTELLELFQKGAFSLSPISPPSSSCIDIGMAKMKAPFKVGLYYDIFLLPNNGCFIFIADPLEQELYSLFSSANLRGIVRTLIATQNKESFSSISFILALQKQMKEDVFIANFALSYLYVNPNEEKLHFFNAGLSQLIHVPAGEESKVLFNSHPLLAVSSSELSETLSDWKIGDVLVYHSFCKEHQDSPKKQNQIELHLKQTIKKELFLSAQSQAESLLRESYQSPLFLKNKQTRILFSIQRTF